MKQLLRETLKYLIPYVDEKGREYLLKKIIEDNVEWLQQKLEPYEEIYEKDYITAIKELLEALNK